MLKSLWIDKRLGPYGFKLLNLDHPDIVDEIISEIDSGVDVYYDRRWSVTETFCRFLVEQPWWVENKAVLVIGAGVGLETLVIGKLCKKAYINDLAQIALNLCARQLEINNIKKFELMPGRYEQLHFPPVDMAIGCYLVYDKDTARSMTSFLENRSCPVLLMNEELPEFMKLIENFPETKCLFKWDGLRLMHFLG